MSETRSATDLLYAMQGLALARSLPIPADLAGLKVFLPFLEDLREDNALFVLHFVSQADPQGELPYVASISRGRMERAPEVAVRANSMGIAIAQAILEYAHHCWNFEW